MTTLKSLYTLLAITGMLALQGCFNTEEDECTVTTSPLTADNIDNDIQNFSFNSKVDYREVTQIMVDVGFGTCNPASVKANWDYSGRGRIEPLTSTQMLIETDFATSGDICVQLVSDEGSTGRACQQVIVNRDNVWGVMKDDLPEASAAQSVTYTLNGDVYSGFGGNSNGANHWYKFDTLNWEWIEKASVPNVTVFTAFGGFALNGKGYLIGNNSKVYQYDPAADTWTGIGDFPVNIAEAFNFGGLPVRGYNVPIISTSVNGKG